jgi:UDP-3-O-[3-hydroxymyristoyl] glucosamine N-acyltransferase
MDTRINTILSSAISEKFDLELVGDGGREINNIGSLNKKGLNSLLWSKNTINLMAVSEGVVICSKKNFVEIEINKNVVYLLTESNPRLVFAKVVSTFFPHDPDENFLNCVNEHRTNKKIRIGENVFIGKNVDIGEGTQIFHNVSIHSNTKIGKFCIIMSNTTISTEGLGLEFDNETGRYFKFPQIGGVILGDYVEIGPNSTVRRSALENTIIGNGTKIGSLSNIAHNCIIGENCIFTGNVVTSGSSKIGSNVFVGIGVTIKQGVNIGDNATLGQGAVVVKNVPENETWVGNPAKKISK